MDAGYREKQSIILHLEIESDIGKVVSDWTCNYNNSHGSITRNSLLD